MTFQILKHPQISALDSMDLDLKYFKNIKKEICKPLLHLYQWRNNTISYGRFLDINPYIQEDKVKEKKIDVVRRPTGGGILFHEKHITYSLFFPADHIFYSKSVTESYLSIHRSILQVMQKLMESYPIFPFSSLQLFSPEALDQKAPSFCMMSPVEGDIMYGAYKIGGGAQRKNRFALLYQGYLMLAPFKPESFEGIFKDSSIFDSMLQKQWKHEFNMKEEVYQKCYELLEELLPLYLSTITK